ncbi:hypothetical protein SBV1_1000025 [Verrucomicrobia bacterium]|nr:hypothetical protein SBV1_1000025 [Verrucomicrobiota bacterium]
MRGEAGHSVCAVGGPPKILPPAALGGGQRTARPTLGAGGGPANIPTAGGVGRRAGDCPPYLWGVVGGPANIPTAGGVGRRAEDCPPYLWGVVGGPANIPTSGGVGRRAEDCPPYLWGAGGGVANIPTTGGTGQECIYSGTHERRARSDAPYHPRACRAHTGRSVDPLPASPWTIGAQCRALPQLVELRRQAVVWSIDPHPMFCAFAQSFAHRIHEDVAGFLLQFPMIPQPMVKKISLPIHAGFARYELFPVLDRGLHARLARKG